jgi:fatty-acyl-CoA synthase
MHPGRNAVTAFETGERITYAELKERCDRIAKGLMAAGVAKGDRVTIWSTNSAEWIIALFAVAKIGAVLVTANTNNKIHDMEYLLAQSDSATLFLSGGSETTICHRRKCT